MLERDKYDPGSVHTSSQCWSYELGHSIPTHIVNVTKNGLHVLSNKTSKIYMHIAFPENTLSEKLA